MFDQLSMFDTESPEPPELPEPAGVVPPRSDDAPGSLHSLFFAVLPAAEDASRLHAEAALLDRRLVVGGRALEADRLHVSLHALSAWVGMRPDADIARWCRAGAKVRCAPFEVVFDRVATLGGEGRPLVFKSADDLGAEGLLALHQALGMALADTGERIKRQRITPHMTMSYRGKRTADTAIEPVRWCAHELVLIDSRVGAHRHDVIGRWPLQG